jgi:low temperature requirement protein LtrA
LLHEDLSLSGFLVFLALFFPVWWAWVGFTYYADQFGTDDPVFRSVVVVAMFGVIAFATTIHDVLAGGTVAFAAACLFLRLLVVGLYAQTWLVAPDLRTLCRPWIAGFTLGAGMWTISLFVSPTTRYLLWLLGLGIEMATPVVSNLDSNAPVQVSHLPERFGLFTILVLGEVVLAVGTGTMDIECELRGSVVAASSFVIAVCIYSLYFRNFDWTATTQGISGDLRTLAREFVYGYNHPLVFAGIVATGVGAQAAIESTASGHPFSVGGRVAFIGGLTLFLFAITASQWATPRSISHRVLPIRLIVIGAVGLLGVVSARTLVTVALIAVVLVGLVAVVEVDSRFGRPASEGSRTL